MEAKVNYLKTSSSCHLQKAAFKQDMLDSEEYVLKFELNDKQNTIYGALSTYEVAYFSLNSAGVVTYGGLLDTKHTKRINDIFLDEDVLYTCSNDSSCHLFDLKGNKLIKSFKRNKEIYSISKSKHILAGADEGGIVFWDLRTMKQRNEFNETHGEEVTCVRFNPHIPTQFVSSSLDGMLCLFDLAEQNEEDACKSIIRTDQPVDRCGYISNEIVYGITTVDSVFVMNTQNDTVMQNINAIEHTELNKDYLIDAVQDMHTNEFKIFVGKEQGYIEERVITKVEDKITQNVSKIMKSQHPSQIRQIKVLSEGVFLTAGEDGTLQVLTATDDNIGQQMIADLVNKGKTFESKMDEEEHQMFGDINEDEEEDQAKKKKHSKKTEFKQF